MALFYSSSQNPPSSHTTVYCLLSTIQRTNQLKSNSLQRSFVHSEISLFLSHPLFLILIILKYIPFALTFPSPLPLYYLFFVGEGVLICPCLGSLPPPNHTFWTVNGNTG